MTAFDVETTESATEGWKQEVVGLAQPHLGHEARERAVRSYSANVPARDSVLFLVLER
jgi:hypothetical protein